MAFRVGKQVDLFFHVIAVIDPFTVPEFSEQHPMPAIGIQMTVGVQPVLRVIVPHILSGEQLDAELSAWLKDAEPADGHFPVEGCKAIIAPSVAHLLRSVLE
jgi:hypothetical protein